MVGRRRRWQRQQSIGCGGLCGSVSGLLAALGLAAASAVGQLRRRCCCDSRAVVAFLVGGGCGGGGGGGGVESVESFFYGFFGLNVL